MEISGLGSDSEDYPGRPIQIYTPSGGSLTIPAGLTAKFLNNPELNTQAGCSLTGFITYQPSGTTYPIIA